MITMFFWLYFGGRAFRNGWRFRVFWPIGVTAAASMIVGFLTGIAGGDVLEVFPLLMAIEFVGLGTVGYMAFHPPQEAPVSISPYAISDGTTN